MKARSLLLFAAVIALCVGGANVWRTYARHSVTSDPSAMPIGRVATGEIVAVPRAKPTEVPRVGPPVVSHSEVLAVIPSIDTTMLATPLPQRFAELERRALAGDLQANCRLAADLDLCLSRRKRVGQINIHARRAGAAEPGSKDEAFHASIAARLALQSERAEAVCAGVTPEQTARAWEFLLRAAELGDDRAALRFVVNPPLDAQNFLGDLSGWEAYRSNAARMLELSVSRGNPYALVVAAGLYAGTDRAGGDADVKFPGDPFRATVYATAALGVVDARSRTLLEGILSTLRQNLSTSQFDNASKQGREFARTYDARNSISALDLFDETALPDLSDGACDH